MSVSNTSSPAGVEQRGEDGIPSIEEFKWMIQTLELEASVRCSELQRMHSGSNCLCSTCSSVGELLLVLFERESDPDAGNAVSRDATGNIFLDDLEVILRKEGCSLCSLITMQFLRSKRRQIYQLICDGSVSAGDLSLETIADVIFELQDPQSWIEESQSTVVQLSLGSLAVDGTLSFWWPEFLSDSVDDEPLLLPISVEDYLPLFGKPKPWVHLRTDQPQDKSLTMLVQCFDICKYKHTLCGSDHKSLPKRLIDVQNMLVKETDLLDSAVQYVALSYVWGRSPSLLLTKSNENSLFRRNGLQKDLLSQTIVDAMEVCQQFGFRFIWIDALCIMQDSYEDKMNEIRRMHSIYASADLTIVAATGPDSSSGLIPKGDVSSDVRAHRIAGQRFLLDAPEMRSVTEFSTWFTRGWTLQELIFSRKILYFTPERTYYTCTEGNWSEDFPVGLESFMDDDPKLGFNFTNAVSPFENYNLIVEKISVRDFTKESDVLNACQGFHTGVLYSTMGDLVCGIPANCFEYCLAWQADGKLRRRGSSSIGSEFPSWSWAGWVGPITYPLLSGPEETKVEYLSTWSFYQAIKLRTSEEDMASGPDSLYPVLPSMSSKDLLGRLTTWSFTPLNLHQMRKWQGLEIKNIELPARIPSKASPMESGLLFTRTSVITCQAVLSPGSGLASRKDIEFLSITSQDDLIGEINLDVNTLAPFITNSLSPEPITIELIPLFKIDFQNSSMQSIIWRNKYSNVGQFSRAFGEFLEEQTDLNMYATMWIRWEDGIAYRVAVGYVTQEGFRTAGPAEKEILLG
ncbi:heterokaryon incompatibility protein-domain-containing protein [Bisporella sp. PMI_857]|nr:heterokaryon incompatibility protein-domain-containing protein [Bisporella sp. PMI_857]